MIKKCPKCESIAVVYEDYVGGTSYYRCQTCGYRGSDFELPTVFDQVTQSPEVLAPNFVYHIDYGEAGGGYVSTIVRGLWHTEAEAIAATVVRLKEAAE